MFKSHCRRKCFYIIVYITSFCLWPVNGGGFSRRKENAINNNERLVSLRDSYNTVNSSWTNTDSSAHNQVKRSIAGCQDDNCTLKAVDVTSWILSGDGNMNAIVYWTGKDSKRMFILSCQEVNTTKDWEGRSACISKSNIYKSEDYGTTFTLENEKFPADTLLHAVYFSRLDEHLLMVTDVKHKTIYISRNSGLNYTGISVPFAPIGLTYHPSDVSHLLGYSPYEQVLFVSTTMGMNWTRVCEHRVLRYYWGVPGIDHDPSLIYLEINHVPFIKITTNHVSTFAVARSPYNGIIHPFSQHIGHIVRSSLYIEKEYILIQEESTNKLYVSYQRRIFMECQFPIENEISHYYVADASENEIILAILHHSYTNLYISDITGRWFTLALRNVVSSDTSSWERQFPMVDVHLVEGLRGTYLANKIGEGTLITYDKGGSWHYLEAPEYNTQGSKTNCNLPSCSLHLQLYVRRLRSVYGVTPVLSKRSAPGLIIAQGILGSSDPRRGSISVYVSRDGGFTWNQSIDKPFGFVIIDHGSVIVTAPLWSYMNIQNNRLRYSCTEGDSWTLMALSSQVIQIIGLLTESAAESPIVTIFGRHSTWKKFEWSIWRLNFTSAFDFKCSKDNYTTWSPRNGQYSNHSCILGESLTFKRRKPNVCCLNGFDFDRPINVTKCQCTLRDFECDFGFIRSAKTNKCLPLKEAKKKRPFPCPEGTTYLESRGYRKIIGDKCDNGIQSKILPVEKRCPPQSPNGFSLAVSKHSVAVYETVEFKFSQRRGFLKTVYSWNYGDNTSEKNIKTYRSAHHRTHAYSKTGEYTVQLTAFNDAGSYTISTTIFVIDKVSHAFLRHCDPAVVAKACQFHVIVDPTVTHNPNIHGFVHFAWIFNPKERPVLSFSPYIDHSFKASGSYDIEVQVINPVGVLPVSSIVTVYDKIKEIQLQFSSTIDMVNDESAQWTENFSKNLHLYLTKRYHLEKDKLVVKTKPKIPTISSVFVVYKKSNSKPLNLSSEEKELMRIVTAIVTDLKKKQARVYLNGNSYRILSADVIHHDDHPNDGSKNREQSFGLQVGLPIALGIAFLAFLVLVYHYHNKCFPGRYRFIRQSRSSQLLDFASLTSSSLSDLSLHPDS